MKCSMRNVLVLIAALCSAVAQAQTLRFAGTEIYGTAMDDSDLLGDIPVPAIGQAIAADDVVLDQLCPQVRERLGNDRFLSATCMVVGYPNGDLYVVIDVVEPHDRERITYPAIQYIDHLNLAERGGERRSEELIACARGCAQAADRADALDFLNRLDWGKASCKAALNALDDRDWTVRNQAAILINQHLVSCVDTLGSTRIVDASLRQLTRPTHADRNKAIATLNLLIRSRADIDDTHRERIRIAADQLARSSILPNVGGTARSLIEAMRADASPRIEAER